MPRRNPNRIDTGQRAVAARLREERKAMGWSLKRMAAAISDAGCPMAATTLYKIEDPGGTRCVYVAEWIAFARVLGVSHEDMLRPMDPVDFAQRQVVRARRDLDLAKERSALLDGLADEDDPA